MQDYTLEETSTTSISSQDEDEIDYVLPTLQRQHAFQSLFYQECPCSPILNEVSTNVYHEQNCPICFQNDYSNTPLKCGHVFCNLCIQTLIQQTNKITCPICRAIQQVDSLQELQSLREMKQ